MNKTSLLMLVVGTILGIVIGYVTFSAKPAASEETAEQEYLIEAEGFRNINYENEKFDIEIVKRVDEDNLEVVKTIRLPVKGFTDGRSAMDQLIQRLVEEGILKESDNSDTPAEE